MYNKESRRTKIITFRVSQEEYSTLEAACTAHRLSSISHLARDAVQQWICWNDGNGAPHRAQASPSALLESQLQEVENRIWALTADLARLQHLAQLQRKQLGAPVLASFSATDNV